MFPGHRRVPTSNSSKSRKSAQKVTSFNYKAHETFDRMGIYTAHVDK